MTLAAGNDTTVTNGHCYEYRELLSDHVGNQGTSGASNVAKVDSQGPANSIALSNVSPAGSALKNGSTVYYRGSAAGSFKLTNGVTDGESGPASSASAALGGTTGGWSHTPSTVSTPSSGPYDSNTFGWSAGSTSTPTEVLTAADQAGNSTSSATLTFANDSNAPTGGALTVNGTPATGGGNSSYSASGSFPIDVRTDYTETQSGSESGLASSTLTRASATLTANSCGSFGSASTITGAPAQSLSTGCYLYTLAATDNVGNSVSITTIVKVDTDNPTVSLTDPGTPVAGTIALSATASDPSTDIQQVVFERAPAGGSTWTAIGTDTTSPYTASWDTTAVSDGQYDVRAVATDKTNNTNHEPCREPPGRQHGSGNDDRCDAHRSVQRHDADLLVQLLRGRLDLRMPRRRRRLGRVLEPRDARCARRRQPHLRRPGNGRGGQHRRDACELHVGDRPHRTRHHDRRAAGRSVVRHHTDLRVQLLRARLDVRVPDR